MAVTMNNPPGPRFRPDAIRSAAAVADNTVMTLIGYGFFITASVTGTVTLTLDSGDTIIITPAVGDNIYPFAVSKMVAGTAVVTRAYNIA